MGVRRWRATRNADFELRNANAEDRRQKAEISDQGLNPMRGFSGSGGGDKSGRSFW